MHARIGQHLGEAARRITSGGRITASVRFDTITPPLINPADQVELAILAATEVVGSSRVIRMEEPVTAGEDFALMLEQRPGAFIFLGNGVSKTETVDELRTELPPPQYDFNDEIISAGVSYWVKLVTRRLSAPEDSGA
jgi:hippurate hydrolase